MDDLCSCKSDYDDIFDIDIVPLKSLKGDTKQLKEIKINKKVIFYPKSESARGSGEFNNFNKLVIFSKKKEDNNENIYENSQVKLLTSPKIDIENFKYFIDTDETSFIKIPNKHYGTNDQDLKGLIDLMNEPPIKEYGYSKVIIDKSYQIYKKHREGCDVILIKCRAKIPYSKEIIFDAIANLDIRKTWDSVFSELKVVNHEGENGAEILYMIIKSPVFFVKDRDFVQQRKMWKFFPTSKSHVLHFISVETKDCPLNKKYVRAETVISGYYIQDDPDEPGHSILGILSQTDIKGSIPVALVNKVAPSSSKGWIKSLIKGCKLVAGEDTKAK